MDVRRNGGFEDIHVRKIGHVRGEWSLKEIFIVGVAPQYAFILLEVIGIDIGKFKLGFGGFCGYDFGCGGETWSH